MTCWIIGQCSITEPCQPGAARFLGRVSQSKTSSFLDSRQSSHLLQIRSSPPPPDLAAGKGGSFRDGLWLPGPEQRVLRAPLGCLTCMMSMAMAGVWTPSTLFTSQCTTSALMKQEGERPFCSESSWTPVLSSNAGHRQQGACAPWQQRKEKM